MRTSSVRKWPTIAAAAVLLLASRPAQAQKAAAAPQPSREELEKRIQELEDAVKQLRTDTRQLEVKNDEAARNKPAVEWKNGFTINTPEGDFKLRIGGYAQADGRFFIDNLPGTAHDQFLLRRARIDVSGTVFKYFDFRLLPDFGQGQTVLFDAYLKTNFIPEANVWFGKYKPPVGLERLQSALALNFIERAQPTNLVPNRDVGAMLQGTFLNGAILYSTGIFNNLVDLGNVNLDSTDDSKDFAGRVFSTPFKDTSWEPLRGLGVGLSGTFGHHHGQLNNTDLPSYVTSLGQQVYFSYVTDSPATPGGTAIANGQTWRVSPQAYWYWGPFGSMYEFVSSSTTVSRQDATAGLIKAPVDNNAWQVALFYVLTGEDASYAGVTPAENFNPLVGTWGAFQLGLRYDGLKVQNSAFVNGFADPNRSANKVQEFTTALNWYWNRSIMLALAYEYAFFDGGLKGGNRHQENTITTRLQFVY